MAAGSTVYPLSLPAVQRRKIKQLATATGLTEAEAMRQSMALGAPLLRERLARTAGRITNVEPVPQRAWREHYRRTGRDSDAEPALLSAQSPMTEAE